MYKAIVPLATPLSTFLSRRLLVAGLIGMVLISNYQTARAELTPAQLTPAEIQKKVHVGDEVIIGTKDWFVIGSEKYKVFTLQVTQVTSAALVGLRVEAAGNRIATDEGEVTVPFEQIDTVKDAYKASFHEKFKCSLRLLPYAVVNPYTAASSASGGCADVLFPPPHAGGLP
jgi:hypothetical protein